MAINQDSAPNHFSPEESNALISALFSSGADGMAFITPDCKVRYANEQILQTVNIPFEKALGTPIEFLIPGWSGPMNDLCRKARLTGEPFTADLCPMIDNRPAKGDTSWNVTIRPVNGTDGAFLGWLLLLREIAGNRQDEDINSIHYLDDELALLDNSLAGAAILDGAALIFKWANKTFLSIVNQTCPLGTLKGLSFEKFIPADQKKDWLSMLREVAESGIPVRDKLLDYGDSYWNCCIFPITNQAPVCDLMVVIYNITGPILTQKMGEALTYRVETHLHQLEAVIENMGDGVIIFDLNGKILNINSMALRLLEYVNRQECPAYLCQIQSDLKLYDLEGNALPNEFWPSNQIIRGEIVDNFEAAVRRIETGALKYSSYNGALIKGADNESPIAVMTIHDITEREILIRQLEQEQARLQAVLEQMPCGVIMFEAPSQRTVLTNKKYEEIWRVKAAGTEIGEQNWPGSFFHSDGRPYRQTELPIVRSVRWGEIIANEEIVCQRQDGSWMVAICNSAPILDREGKIVAGVVVFSDITELKEATTKAALANQLQQIIEFLPDGTFVADQNRRVIAWNRALELLTGVYKCDIIGTDAYKAIFSSGNMETLTDLIFEGMAVCPDSGANRSGEALAQQILFPVLNRRENVLLDLKATPIRNEQGEITGMIETIRDITHQKQMEAETIRMQKLDSLGILAGGIAHDFNNILAAILANLQLAALKLKHKEDILQYLDHTIEITRRASSLTRQLLTFAKGGAPVKKTASILDLITDTVEFALRGSKVKARFHFQENPWAVEIDEGQITQVINNLTINAVQAMPQGGILEIRFENVVLTAENHYHPGRYVKLSFEDSGCGIPADIIDKIFDPFFTTKEVGNGLGLSTSYSIIKRHNGYIEAESLLGNGATFYIYLPASGGEPALPEEFREVAAAGESKILLMDDDEVIRQVVSDMLIYYGYRITVAKDGNEAIGYYRQAMSAGERFDVVIMDLTVPGGMGGLETMAVLCRIDPRVKAIISSGYANDPVMSDYKEYGFCGFVAKPYKFDELIEALNTALKQT